MVAVVDFMEEAVSEPWVDSSFQEPSDKECQGLNLDTEQPQTAVLNRSIESQLTGSKKQILIHPLLYNTGDSGDLGHTFPRANSVLNFSNKLVTIHISGL